MKIAKDIFDVCHKVQNVKTNKQKPNAWCLRPMLMLGARRNVDAIFFVQESPLTGKSCLALFGYTVAACPSELAISMQ